MFYNGRHGCYTHTDVVSLDVGRHGATPEAPDVKSLLCQLEHLFGATIGRGDYRPVYSINYLAHPTRPPATCGRVGSGPRVAGATIGPYIR